MAQPEISRLELKVIEAEPVVVQPVPLEIRRQQSPTGLAIRSNGSARTNTGESWPSSVFILEEVELPASLDPRLVVLRDPNSARARSYRLLRHRLMAQADPRVIAVTSGSSGEGKTTCAANLALVLAEETFSRVLLLEVNVGRPGLAELFGYEPADSFIGRLVQAQDARPPYLVAKVRRSQLHVAALSSTVPRDARLDRLLLGLAVSDLRYLYDYIVIDGPSLFDSADADAANECSDGVIIAARAGKSRRSGLRRVVEQIGPVPLLGVVLLDA